MDEVALGKDLVAAPTVELTHALAEHVVKHLDAATKTILQNNIALAKHTEGAPGSIGMAADGLDCYRDQGYTRAKVLVLAPFRHVAYVFMKEMLRACGGTSTGDSWKRFETEFGPGEDDGPNPRKPADYNETFAGNIDDCFRIGVKFSRGHLKFYSNFQSADLIIASPLSLQMIISNQKSGSQKPETDSHVKTKINKSDGSMKDTKTHKRDKSGNIDFLSSIEISICLNSHIFIAQNFMHVNTIFSRLNNTPINALNCDFSRIRATTLNNESKDHRQSIFLTEYMFPELNALVRGWCSNVKGISVVKKTYETGDINNVIVKIPQQFLRVDGSQLMSDESIHAHFETRFTFFKTKIVPILTSIISPNLPSSSQQKTIVVIPDYFDYIRVKTYLKSLNMEYASICEYTVQKNVDKARHKFSLSRDDGGVSILIYTGRAHFHRRYKLRCSNLIVYQPPVVTKYSEYVNMLQSATHGALDGGSATLDGVCVTMYSEYDYLRMERCVGSERALRMCAGDTNAYMFFI